MRSEHRSKAVKFFSTGNSYTDLGFLFCSLLDKIDLYVVFMTAEYLLLPKLTDRIFVDICPYKIMFAT